MVERNKMKMVQNKNFMGMAIMMIFFTGAGAGTVTSAIYTISEAFPTVPYVNIMLVSTVPSLMVIPFSIISGAIVGSKVKYRMLVMLGILLFVIGGVTPVFMNNIPAITVSMGVCGIGLGIIAPIGSSLILKLFDGQKRADMTGRGTVFMTTGAVVFQILASFLCSINWHYTFLAHAFGIISLVIIFFNLPEPEPEPELTEIKTEGKVRLPASAYLYSILHGIFVAFSYPSVLNMSKIILSENIANVASVGIVNSMMTAGGVLAGIIFGKVYKKTKLFAMPIGLMLSTIGMCLVYFGNNLIMLMIGQIFVGTGMFLFFSSVTIALGRVVPPSGIGMSMGVMRATMNMGGFLATYYIAGLLWMTGNDSPRFPIFVSIWAFLIGAVILMLVNIKASKTSVNP
jgi:MFS family permease